VKEQAAALGLLVIGRIAHVEQDVGIGHCLFFKKFINLFTALANLFGFLGQRRFHLCLPLVLALLAGTEHLHELCVFHPVLSGKMLCRCFHNRRCFMIAMQRYE